MKKLLVVGIILFAVNTVLAKAQVPDSPVAQETVVSKQIVRPTKVVYRHATLNIPEHPTVGEVLTMINVEAETWGVSAAALEQRVRCESGFNWLATNGQYVGLLQFAPSTFYRGLTTIRTRKVVVLSTRVRRMHSRIYRHWSSGMVTRSRGRIVKQRILTTRTGYLLKNPAPTDPWTQIRIGAQALRGISSVRSSEWSCAA